MQYDYYEYGTPEVNLAFKFQKGEKNTEQKQKFLALLKQATSDLEAELGIGEKE